MDRLRLAERRQDLRFGLLASIVVNSFGGETAPGDFFPERADAEPLGDQLDEEATLAIARQMIANLKREQDDEDGTRGTD